MDGYDHAVVVGAGIAGLVAAQALSGTYRSVTVFDRDRLPSSAMSRRGVPQGGQAHGLLAAGRDALESLFPGLSDELKFQGAPYGDLQSDFRFYFEGRPVAPGVSGVEALAMSRPFLEDNLRRRLIDTPQVEIVDELSVRGLVSDQGRVTGVLLGADGPDVRALPADLVVDATGRGSRSNKWLELHGFGRPETTRVAVGGSYVSRRFSRGPCDLGGLVAVSIGTRPGVPRGAMAMALEDDQLIVTLTGVQGVTPPTDLDGFRGYAATLARPDVAEVLRTADPIGEATTFVYSASRRFHYERMATFPAGLLVIGDAWCSFNPAYGQGMTLAARQGLWLSEVLKKGSHDLAARFYAAARGDVEIAWRLAGSKDVQDGGGRHSPAARLVSRYLSAYKRAAAQDAELGRIFLRVANLLDPPSALFRPSTLQRLLVARLARDSRPAAAPVPVED